MSDILRRARLVNREIFEPTNEAHVASLKIFLVTGSWGDVQFYPEAPYTEAPATVMTKYARHTLGVTVESFTEKAARLAGRNVITIPYAEEPVADRLVAANVLMTHLLGTYLPKK